MLDVRPLATALTRFDYSIVQVLWAHTLVMEQNDWMQLAHEKLDIYEKKLIGHASKGIDTGRCIFCGSL